MKQQKKVEDLPRFGEPFMTPPKSAELNAMKTLLRTMRKKMGFFGMISFMIECITDQKKVKIEYREAFSEVEKINKGMAGMTAIFVSVLRVLAKRYNRKEAYAVIKTAMDSIGKHNMPLIYDSDALAQCTGDRFTNFKKFNIAAFERCVHDGVINISQVLDEENMQKIVLDRCDGCKIGNLFGWPEIGKMGCDHDLAGFPVIEDKHDIVFRRHKTLAKGDDICEFIFYRKGTEPELVEEMK